MTPLPVLDCAGCGACCRHMGGSPTILVSAYATPEEAARLTPGLRDELLGLVARWRANPGTWPKENDPCIWYDAETKKCRHYDQRPDVCREFEVGADDCLRVREMYGIDAR